MTDTTTKRNTASRQSLPLEHPVNGTAITAIETTGAGPTARVVFELTIDASETPRLLPEFISLSPDQRQTVDVQSGALEFVFPEPAFLDRYPDSLVTDSQRLLVDAETAVELPGTARRLVRATVDPTRVRVCVEPGGSFEPYLRGVYNKAAKAHAPFAAFETDTDVIENPVTGERIRFLERSVDTRGERLVYEHLLPAGVSEYNLHSMGVYLPFQTKYVRVLRGCVSATNLEMGTIQRLSTQDHVIYGASGFMNVSVGIVKIPLALARAALDTHRTLTVGPLVAFEGEELRVEPTIPYKLSNPGTKDTIVRVELLPALRTEQLLESLFGLAAAGNVHTEGSKRARPTGRKQFAVLRSSFEDEFQLPKGHTIPTVTNAILSLWARRYGTVDWRPEYSPNPEASKRATELSAF